MPPKAPPPKKLTKKELKEKMLEEQRQREEQERIRKEEEEKKRLEEERLRKLEEERLAAEEKARLHEEEIENEVTKSVFRENLENAKKLAKANDDWDKFLLCSTSPDIILENQLTTFITTLKEQKPIQDLKVFEELAKIQQGESVIKDINKFITQLLAERSLVGKQNDKNELINRNKGYIKQIREIMCRKIEEVNTHMVVNAEFMIEVIQYYIQEKMIEMSKKPQEGKPYKVDDKNKLELIKTFPPVDDIKYGIFIYPINKPSGYRHKPNEFTELQIQADIPRQITMFVQKVLWTSYDNYSNEDIYNTYRIVGGVLDVEYLSMLQPPKKMNNWTLKHHYEINEIVKRNMCDLNAALRISYSLPPYVWIPNKESYKWRVAIYDKQNEQWIQEGIEDPKLEKNIQIFAAVPKLGPVGLLQERCSDFPYKSFKLRCIANEKAILDIEGRRDVFTFEIGSGYITLLKNDPEFQEYAYKKLPVGTLFFELYRSGVNLMPVIEDANSANIIVKDEGAEELALSDLGEAVRGFFIESSRWNNSETGGCIVTKIKENPEFDQEFAENQEKDWKTIKWWGNKCANIQARDSHQKCNQDLVPDTETHCNLEVLLKLNQLTSPEILQKIKDLHFVMFIETVQQVLRISKLLSFTVID